MWNQDLARPMAESSHPDGGPEGNARRRAEIEVRNHLARAVRIMHGDDPEKRTFGGGQLVEGSMFRLTVPHSPFGFSYEEEEE